WLWPSALSMKTHLPNKWFRKSEKCNKGKGNDKTNTKTDGQVKIGENWYDLDFCDLAQVDLKISEMDICRDPSMDLLDEATAKRALQQIRDGSWDVVIVTPPCNTFSRVRFAQPDPKPVRSRLYPLGFPWLSDNLLEFARQGNQFIDFSFQVCFATLDAHADFLLEHPEDLGRTRSGHTPALFGSRRMLSVFSHMNVSSHLLSISADFWLSHLSQRAS
ncbi:unnamed protein product, partial [Symbiodinium pilosum]